MSVLPSKYVSMVSPTVVSHGEYGEYTFDKALTGAGIFTWSLLYGDIYEVHVHVYSTNSGSYAVVSTLNNRVPPGWAAFAVRIDDIPSLSFFIKKYVLGEFPFKDGYFRRIERDKGNINTGWRMAAPVAPSVPSVSVASSGGRRRNRRTTKKARRNRRRYSRNK
jgi:hypothetical protein